MARPKKPRPAIVGALEIRLGAWGPIEVKRLFSGYALYRDGTIFGLVMRERVYFKTNDANRPDYVAAGMAPFQYTRSNGRVIATHHYEVPGFVFDDLDELTEWADKALAVTRGHGLQSDIREVE
ncbi:MAG TPA: TfoX/Sxy family protein [Aliidongia sp.]|uniref:TfoX/Sxy family protein n=1 Tax=Aliidongia sp. TaxID=1914230 RepID=UPI002DDD31D7|nr:TfoX/Sxy family protein [Aliidongia sp.]HEV2675772.1 TfoX/Sxy family protein [Aliidongia sp.]